MTPSLSRTLRRTSTAALSLALAGTALFGTLPAQAVSTTINYANCGSDTIYGTHAADVVWDTNAPAKVYVGDPAFPVTATGSAQFNDKFSKHLYWSRVIRSVKGTATVAGTLNQQPGSWPMQFEISKVASGATSAATIAGDLGQVTVPATPGELPITLGNFAVDALGSDGMLTHDKKVTFTCVTAETNPVADIVQVVSKSATTLTVPQVTENQMSRAVATVKTDGGTPAGSVEFTVNGTQQTVQLVNGEAAVDLPKQKLGTYPVTATFVPTDTKNYEGSTAQKSLKVVAVDTTTTTLALSSPTSPEGSPVTAKATIAATSGNSPSGTVIFAVGGKEVSTQVGQGEASVTLPNLPAGLHSVTARFVPADPETVGASESNAASWRVQVHTNTALSLDRMTIGYDDQARATAVVTPSSGTVQGEVAFSVGGMTVTASVVDGRAAVNLPRLATGEYQVTARFTPNDSAATLGSQAKSQMLTVTDQQSILVQPQITLGLNKATVKYGERVFAIADLSDGATGTVSFNVGGVSTGAVDVVNGRATAALPRLAVGSHSLRATFTPAEGSSFQASSAIRQISVKRAPTSMSPLAVKAAKLGKLRKLTVKATVSSPQRVPVTGAATVTLKKGTKVAGRKRVAVKAGKVSATFARLAKGNYTVKVTYLGNASLTTSARSKAVRLR